MKAIQSPKRPTKKTERNSSTPSAGRSKLLSHAEAYALGKKLRAKCPRSAHAQWKLPSNRPDAVELVLAAEKERLPDLLPLRHGRMARSSFTFYRGAALTMASDLSSTPVSGLRVQCCGDAHLSNFGGFATPERRVIFSINDLDETLPAPWEWDIKRLAASFVVACRDNALSDAGARDAAQTCVRTYRESMAEFGEMKTLELWYESLGADDLVAGIKDTSLRERTFKRLQKEKGRSIAEDIFPKIADHEAEMPVIKDQLPTIFHHIDAPPGVIHQAVTDALAGYRSTLPPAVQSLLDRYELRDAAIKVVGIGSVGTRCWVLLYLASEGDPLFLQVKEARRSVLEPYAGASPFDNHGQRVVNGYRLMQPASDMFWVGQRVPSVITSFASCATSKSAFASKRFGRSEMNLYATWCGRALALSHARSGIAVQLSGYMGRSEAFDDAVAAFSMAYADQNEKDHAALVRAIRAGKVEAVVEEKAERRR
jgi:uncharacterized protein (DUF2252 family)